MKKIFLIGIFKSHYCKLVFLISALLISLLIPKKIFYGYYNILAILFILVTSLTATCFIRNIKERILSAKNSGASLIGIISIIFGIGALQVCTIGAPVCGASIGMGIAALLFPGIAFSFAEKYGIWLVSFSIIIQLIALYFMNCFKFINIKKICKNN